MSRFRFYPVIRAWRRFIRAMAIACLLVTGTTCLAAAVTPTRVLYINSYHRGYKWSDDIEQGLRDRFQKSGKNLELSYEYLDSRRFAYGAQLPSIVGSMAVRYRDYRPELVVTSDNAAFDFAVAHREHIFSGVPIVFCGYNNFRADVLKGVGHITGVNEEIDFARAVEMALAIHPHTKAIAFVLSTADLSNRNNARVVDETVPSRFRDRYEIALIKDASLDELRLRLSRLPRDSLLFLAGQVRDETTGRALSPEENGWLIAPASPVPVYTFWDFHLGTGVFGGRILQGYDQGSAAADLALRILNGERPESIPVEMSSPARNIFDYAVMKKFGIHTTELPPDSMIINQPDSIWDEYLWQIVGVVVFMALQTLLVIVLFYQIGLRRKAIAELQIERASLEERVRRRTEDLVGAKALETFAKEQDSAIERERRRLAREVHDQIGQVFTAIKLIIDSLPREAFPPGQASALAQALEMGIASTRRVTAELRPPLLDDLGLAAAVTHFVQNQPGLGSVKCKVVISSQETLDGTQALALFRIMQEAVTNVLRHAKARCLDIVGVAGQGYVMTIADDGCGLDLSAVRPGALGLAGMRERAKLLGGEFAIRPRSGGGTVIEVRVPLREGVQ